MPQEPKPLIAGAGPVGLAAALFLARQGIQTRIIDAATDRSPFSRALAVNPRTLALLESTGITERMLSLGKPIRGGTFWLEDRPLMEFNFDRLRNRHPYLVGLSQAVSERLLHEALVAQGGHVERGVALANCRIDRDGVEVETGPAPEQPREKQTVPWLLAADGAHSIARHRLGIDFPGSTFATPWNLVDVPLNTSLAEDQAHISFLPGGAFVFMIRVIDDATPSQPSAPLWRVMGNVTDPLQYLVQSTVAGPVVWSSGFRIAHRINATMQMGNICFAGDAAHLHSPVGARGMNLGIEDAWVFAELLKRGQLHRYGELRHATDGAVVRRIRFISTLVIGESRWTRFARRHLLPLLAKLGPVQRQMILTVTGLDHDVEV